MIISNSKKFIFIHIPKSGGTSICDMLEPYATWEDIHVGGTLIGEAFNEQWAHRYKMYKHSTPFELVRVMGEHRYKTYTKITTVRNPFKRFISAKKFLCQNIEKKLPWMLDFIEKNDTSQFFSFEKLLDSEFLNRCLTADIEELNEIERCFCHQFEYIDPAEVERGFFQWFKIENPNVMTTVLKNIININEELTIPRHNVGELKDKPSIAVFEKIIEMYSKDYKYFQYSTSVDENVPY